MSDRPLASCSISTSRNLVASKVWGTESPASASTALALIDKAVEVKDYLAYEFKRQGVKGSWKGSGTSNWSAGAAVAGQSAAQNANLFGRKELG